jgi:hypothetical protein
MDGQHRPRKAQMQTDTELLAAWRKVAEELLGAESHPVLKLVSRTEESFVIHVWDDAADLENNPNDPTLQFQGRPKANDEEPRLTFRFEIPEDPESQAQAKELIREFFI